MEQIENIVEMTLGALLIGPIAIAWAYDVYRDSKKQYFGPPQVNKDNLSQQKPIQLEFDFMKQPEIYKR